jgi:hypothetical protein
MPAPSSTEPATPELPTLLRCVFCGWVHYAATEADDALDQCRKCKSFAFEIAGAVSAVFLMFGLPGDTWLRLAIWLIIGLAIYFFYGRHHSLLARKKGAEAGF